MATHTKGQPQPLSIKEEAAQALKEAGLEEGGRLYFTQRLAGLSSSQGSRYGFAFYLPQGSIIVNVTHLVAALLGKKPGTVPGLGEKKVKLAVISALEGAELVSLVSEAVWPGKPQAKLFAVNL